MNYDKPFSAKAKTSAMEMVKLFRHSSFQLVQHKKDPFLLHIRPSTPREPARKKNIRKEIREDKALSHKSKFHLSNLLSQQYSNRSYFQREKELLSTEPDVLDLSTCIRQLQNISSGQKASVKGHVQIKRKMRDCPANPIEKQKQEVVKDPYNLMDNSLHMLVKINQPSRFVHEAGNLLNLLQYQTSQSDISQIQLSSQENRLLVMNSSTGQFMLLSQISSENKKLYKLGYGKKHEICIQKLIGRFKYHDKVYRRVSNCNYYTAIYSLSPPALHFQLVFVGQPLRNAKLRYDTAFLQNANETLQSLINRCQAAQLSQKQLFCKKQDLGKEISFIGRDRVVMSLRVGQMRQGVYKVDQMWHMV